MQFQLLRILFSDSYHCQKVCLVPLCLFLYLFFYISFVCLKGKNTERGRDRNTERCFINWFPPKGSRRQGLGQAGPSSPECLRVSPKWVEEPPYTCVIFSCLHWHAGRELAWKWRRQHWGRCSHGIQASHAAAQSSVHECCSFYMSSSSSRMNKSP